MILLFGLTVDVIEQSRCAASPISNVVLLMHTAMGPVLVMLWVTRMEEANNADGESDCVSSE